MEQIFTDNPLLERLNDALDHATRMLADGGLIGAPQAEIGAAGEASQQPQQDAVASAEQAPALEGGDGQDVADMPAPMGDDGDWGNNDIGRVLKSSDDENRWPQLEANEITLREFALEQSRLTVRDP